MKTIEVPCPLCKAGLSGTGEDALLHEAREHLKKDHPEEDVDKVLDIILGIIRN